MKPITPIPEPVARVADLMSTFGADWCLCGGWGVDAWLGRLTREHGDVDIAVFHDDQRALFDHLAGWELIAHDPSVPGNTTEPWDGRRLDLPAHIHASLDPDTVSAWVTDPAARLPVQDDRFRLEVLLNERSGDDWILRREPDISLPLRRCLQQSAWGVPTAVPEVLLFYKATAYLGVPKLEYRTQDQIDFLALVPRLNAEERAWLRDAISAVHFGHPWLPQLSL